MGQVRRRLGLGQAGRDDVRFMLQGGAQEANGTVALGGGQRLCRQMLRDGSWKLFQTGQSREAAEASAKLQVALV